MNVALRGLIPDQVSVLLSPRRQSAIAQAAFRAEERITRREQQTETIARALQWTEHEADLHVRGHRCPEGCSALRAYRRRIQRLRGQYQESLRLLRKGK